MKLREVRRSDNDAIVAYSFYCPGCGHDHTYYTVPFDVQPVWSFNGDMNNPTFSPSLLNTWTKPPTEEVVKRCHLFVKNGKIEYCGDSTHSLTGQTVDMKDYEG